MKNWRKIEDVWIEFCLRNNLHLDKSERRYFYGKSQKYSTLQIFEDFTISFSHRFEKPDNDVRPEELTLILKTKDYEFIKIEIEKKAFVNKLFNNNNNPIRVKSEIKVPEGLRESLMILLNKFPTANFQSLNNEIRLFMNDFPDSSMELEILRDWLIKASVLLTERAIHQPKL